MIIWHNNRCSKSRCSIDFLNENKIKFQVKYYLETPPTKAEIKDVLEKLGMKASQVVRKGEAIYKEKFKDQTMTEAKWLTALAKYPILIERPIIIKGNKAVIGRPTEKILELK